MNWLKELLLELEDLFTKPYDKPMEPTPQTAPATQNIPKQSLIQKWAKLIEQGEGARPELNNPGNLKYSTLTASWGATKGRKASDGGWLCQFPSYDQGFTALCNFLTLACEGALIISHPSPCTLQAFTMRYAGNPPQGYIDRIAIGLGMPLNADISTFL